MNPRLPVLTSFMLFGAAAAAGCTHETPPPVVPATENTAFVEPVAETAPPTVDPAPPEPSPELAAPAPAPAPVPTVPTVPALDPMRAVFDELTAAREAARAAPHPHPRAAEPTLDAGLSCVVSGDCEQGWTAHGFDTAHQRWFTLSEMPSDDRDEPSPPMLELTTTDARGSAVVRVPENPRGASRIRRALGATPRTEAFEPLRGTSVEGTYDYFDGYVWRNDSFAWVLALEGPFAGWALWTAPNAGMGFVIHLSRLDRSEDRIVFELPGRDDGCSGDLTHFETDERVGPPAEPSNTTGFDGSHACWPPRFSTVLLAPDRRSLLVEGYRSEQPDAPTSDAIHLMVALPPDLVPAL